MKKLIISTFAACSIFLIACSPQIDQVDVKVDLDGKSQMIQPQANLIEIEGLLSGFVYETPDNTEMTSDEMFAFLDKIVKETLDSLAVIEAIMSNPKASIEHKALSAVHYERVVSVAKKPNSEMKLKPESDADFAEFFINIQIAHHATMAYYYMLDKLDAQDAAANNE